MMKWRALWERLLSPQTARFILALLALGFAAYGADQLIGGNKENEPGQAAVFAVGQLFALATMAFGYYFGSTARSDERPITTEIVSSAQDPVHVVDEAKKEHDL